MLRILLKKQLTEIFRSYFYDAKKNQRALEGRDGRVYCAVRADYGGRAGRSCSPICPLSICAPLAQAGMDWLYFALMGLLSVLLGCVWQRVQHLFRPVSCQG